GRGQKRHGAPDGSGIDLDAHRGGGERAGAVAPPLRSVPLRLQRDGARRPRRGGLVRAQRRVVGRALPERARQAGAAPPGRRQAGRVRPGRRAEPDRGERRPPLRRGLLRDARLPAAWPGGGDGEGGLPARSWTLAGAGGEGQPAGSGILATGDRRRHRRRLRRAVGQRARGRPGVRDNGGRWM
ncbi:MAG: hypothetical protein AVDCRST_MAG59-1451, partial [uncultured Thermomicrobiales bacterium]